MIDDTVLIGLVLISRLVLGLIFLRSAWGKIGDMAGFRRGVAAYQLLPPWAITPLARLLPLLELVLATACLLGWLLPAAGLAAALLLLLFIAAIVVNLRRGRVIACNCHGSDQQTPISWGLVIRNSVLVSLTLLLAGIAPFAVTSSTLAAQWQAELTLTVSWAVVPLVLTAGGGVACARLLTATLDLRHTVRRGTMQERRAG